MKKYLIAASLIALTTALSAPSMAQSQYPDQMRNYMSNVSPSRSQGAYNYNLTDTINGPHHEVVTGGRYVGADPDPTVRLDLLRENQSGDHW
jgi:hypothetical protein